MKKYFVITIFIGFSLATMGQLTSDEKSRPNEVGIHAGGTTGVGLSYRHWFERNGFQLTFVPVKTDDLTWISGGVTYLRSFYQGKYVRVFGYLGNHVYHYRDAYDEYFYDYITGESHSETRADESTQYNIGIGPGFSFGKVVVFNLMVGYGFYDVTDRFNMFPTGELGLYYRF
jgi:hypothetical protein